MEREQLDKLKWLLMIRSIDLRAKAVAERYAFGPLTRRYGFGSESRRHRKEGDFVVSGNTITGLGEYVGLCMHTEIQIPPGVYRGTWIGTRITLNGPPLTRTRYIIDVARYALEPGAAIGEGQEGGFSIGTAGEPLAAGDELTIDLGTGRIYKT